MRVLVVDVGGSNIKLGVSGLDERRRLSSGRHLTPEKLVTRVTAAVRDWRYDVIALGVPGAVGHHGPVEDPGNLADGWVGFDFQSAFGKPVRVVNDAVMQALGAYGGGRMLFLGLGTGLGSAIVSDHVVIPLELGNLRSDSGAALGERLGRRGLETNGLEVWRHEVRDTTVTLAAAFLADYVVLGGGNAKKAGPLPPRVRRGGNHDALTGGFRLWEETVEPHDRKAPPVWRVVP